MKEDLKNISSDEYKEISAEMPFGNGKLKSLRWHFDDIMMGHSIVRYEEPGYHHASNGEEAVRLHFGIKGDYSFNYPQIGQNFDLKAGHHNIMYSKGIDLHIYNKSKEVETFGINFPREVFLSLTNGAGSVLKKFGDEVLEGKNAILSDEWKPTDVQIHRIINEILCCRFTGRLKKLFLFSKAIELLVYQAEMFNEKGRNDSSVIKNISDKERIFAARDLVLDNILSPPGLNEIARTVGINEYKLKKGFKELFKTTVFGYLSEHRLDLARKMLLDTSRTASEISFDLGYSSPQHFNNAFKAKFGKAPQEYRKLS